MANLHFAHSGASLKTIQEIRFGVLSPEEIKNMSVCEIMYPETMDDQKQRPKENGLNDPRLGSIDRQYNCGTCGENMSECPGHFGHIELAVPVFHIGYVNKIKKLLEIVCHNCGKVLVDENNPAFVDALRIRENKKRFEAIWKLCKPKFLCDQDEPKDEDPYDTTALKEREKQPKKSHGGCGNLNPEIRKDGLKLIGTWKLPKNQDDEDERREPEKRPVTPQMALNVFRLISDEELLMLGLNNQFARPEWLILTNLPVPPPPVRPSISVDGTGQGMRGEDDLTYKLGDIIRANANVRRCEQEGSPRHVVDEFESLLQYHVATYMDNSIVGQPTAIQKSGRPVKAIRERLKGKEGRLRGNLMGKRVDFSARTVITGDPNLSLDEVGVPRSIARTLTYPETVTPYNIHKLHELVRNGPNNHPGAKYVIRDTGERIDLRHNKNLAGISLQYGWKVERHIIDGDVIIFNRQPSLHKESMMGHRVRVMPYSTFRLNLSVTSPYNADFDGDEMNLHVPQSEETRSEVMNLCMVPLNIVSPQRNAPLMGIVQDTLCGMYKICRRDVFLTKQEIMAILLWVPDWDGVVPPPAIIRPRPRWTGKQVISLALPAGLNLLREEGEGHSPLTDKGVAIENGELMYGLLSKKTVGASGGGVVHTIFNERGWEAAVNFFNGAQRIVCHWLLHNGFSIGIGDTVPDAKTTEMINDTVRNQKAEVEKITKIATADELEALPGMSVRETFENKVQMALNSARDITGDKTEKNLKDLNNAIQMARSGSKGSAIITPQMSAVVGQQAVEGKRIPFGFKYRSLPHFTKDDYSPESRGFVENSYLKGLTPTEFFFHAMAGREGLIDTAVKTAETGYIQRRLVKALEDVMTKYDGTVRNSLGDVVQFIYGEDGLDAVHVETQKVDMILSSSVHFDNNFKIDVMGDCNNPYLELTEEDVACAKEIRGDPRVQAIFDEEYDAIKRDREFLREQKKGEKEKIEEFPLPLNLFRIIDTAKTKFKVKPGTPSDLHPAYVSARVNELISGVELVVVVGDDPISQEANESATTLFKILLRCKLAFKQLVKKYHLTKLAFDHVIGDIANRFARSRVSAGEMVGVLAAQSIGEPATQMTLNTFHFTGIASKNVTLGVPRLKEILNVATNIKTPSMQVFLPPGQMGDQQAAKRLRSLVEHTTLRSVTDATEIWYDPDIEDTVVEADKEMVEAFFIIPDDNEADRDRQSKWVLRLILGRRKLLDKGLTVSDVAAKIKKEYKGDCAVIFSDNNADDLVIRIRLIAEQGKDLEDDEGEPEQGDLLKKLESHLLDTLSLRGIPGVDKAFISTQNVYRELDDGSLFLSKNDDRCKEYFLDTEGINLATVLAVPGIDTTRTTCNSFAEILRVFGIEATRAALMSELKKVLSFDGSYVNHRHLAILVDVMTAQGRLTAVTRFGINRSQTGALMRCSFEETVEILLDAAAAGELDDCRGVSENIMLGQLAPAGTGELEILLDQNMLNTQTSDNSRLGLVAGIAPSSTLRDSGAATPYDLGSPTYEGGVGIDYGSTFSPIVHAGADDTGGFSSYVPSFTSGINSPFSGESGRSPHSYGPTSPFSGTSPTSPGWASPSSPGYSPTSPGIGLTSPRFGGATSPTFSPSSPAYTPTSPTYSPTSPAFGGSPTSPSYSPTSPSYSPTSPSYSPTSPSYSPTSPAAARATSPHYSPTSPQYSPTSPMYSPTSPQFGGGGDRRSPTSPTSPNYSPTSPVYSPTSPAPQSYSPTSPRFSPTSPGSATPAYSPTSPAYSPTSPRS